MIALIVINAIWGFNYVVSKHAVDHFPPIFFTTLRFGLLALCVVPYLRWRPGQMTRLLIGSVFSGAVQFALLFIALGLAHGVASISIAAQLGVPFTALLSVLLLHERLSTRQALGIAVAFAGVALLGFSPGGVDSVLPLLIMTASALAAAVGLVVLKRLGESLEPTEVIAWFAWTGWPVLLALTAWLEHGQLAALAAARFPEWGCLVFSAIVSSLFAYTAFFHYVRLYPVSVLVPLNFLSTVFAIEFSSLLLGEPLSPRIWIAALLTIAGVLAIVLRGRAAPAVAA